MLVDIPSDRREMRRIVHGLVVHFKLDDLKALDIPDERLAEVNSRYADTMLARLASLHQGPLSSPRPSQAQIVGCCRDFAVLLVSMARAHGIPARIRVGFATYFFCDVKIDHVVAEIWDANERRWRLVDAQIGDNHTDPNDGFRVDPDDIPRDRFVSAGDAWCDCMAGDDDPKSFTVRPGAQLPMLSGFPYICHNLVLDLAALNKVEMILWDMWGLIGMGFSSRADTVESEVHELFDRVAEATIAARDHRALSRLFWNEPRLRLPETVTSVDPTTMMPRTVVMRPALIQAA